MDDYAPNYDFEIEHIKGTDNTVADGLSRMCPDDSLTVRRQSHLTKAEGREMETNEEESVDVLVFESIDFVDSLSISKIFIAQQREEFEYMELVDFWALAPPVLEDQIVMQSISMVHNDVSGHWGVLKVGLIVGDKAVTIKHPTNIIVADTKLQ